MARKRLPDDFKDFLNSLNKNNVEYLLLGGWAVGMYGQPRATGDMDVLVAIDDANGFFGWAGLLCGLKSSTRHQE